MTARINEGLEVVHRTVCYGIENVTPESVQTSGYLHFEYSLIQ